MHNTRVDCLSNVTKPGIIEIHPCDPIFEATCDPIFQPCDPIFERYLKSTSSAAVDFKYRSKSRALL